MGISKEHNPNNTYENGDECVPIWKRREMRMIVYVHIRRNWNNRHAGRKDRHMSSVMRITSSKVVMNMEQNTKHAARATQIEQLYIYIYIYIYTYI